MFSYCTCFKKRAAVIDPPSLPPVLTMSACLLFIMSQYASSIGIRQNFSPAAFAAAVTSSAMLSWGVNRPAGKSMQVKDSTRVIPPYCVPARLLHQCKAELLYFRPDCC